MIAAIVTRLATVAALVRVEATAGLANLDPGRARAGLPAAFVYPMQDAAGPNRFVNGTMQELTRRVGVLLIEAMPSAARGRDVPDPLETLLAATRAALVGWQPDADHTPLLLARGSMVELGQGEAWWLDELTTDTLLRSV